jgi:endonuclease G
MNITVNTPNLNAPITINIKVSGNSLASAELETKKGDEANADYSNCKGFDVNFMGFDTPLPMQGKQLKRKVASFLSNKDSNILKYHHFSAIQHAVRKMPVVSAINMAKKRPQPLYYRKKIWRVISSSRNCNLIRNSRNTNTT